MSNKPDIPEGEEEQQPPIGFENPGYNPDADDGEVVPYTPDANRFASFLSSFNRKEMLERLAGTYEIQQEPAPNQPSKNPALYWQRPSKCWIIVHHQDDLYGQFYIEEQKVLTAEDRHKELAKKLTIEEVEVSKKDRSTFNQTLNKYRDLFYSELLRLSAIELGLDSATEKVKQVLAMILGDEDLRVEFVQVKLAMQNLVDQKFFRIIAESLDLNPDLVMIANHLQENDKKPSNKLHELLQVLDVQRPEEK